MLGFHFTEVAHVYCNPRRRGMPSGGMPRELVLSRFGQLMVGIVKPQCSAASSSGFIAVEQDSIAATP